MTLASKTKLPWASLGFKNLGYESYLALITSDGNFSILEPRDHENLAGDWIDWMEKEEYWASGEPPHRSLETSFKLSFNPDPLPCWTALEAGVPRKALLIAVASMETVKVFRTDAQKRIHLATELFGATDIIRDVAWAPGSVRGFDVIATASKDGYVRVYEMRTTSENQNAAQLQRQESGSVQNGKSGTRNSRNAPSGIGARLAGAAGKDYEETYNGGQGSIRDRADLVAELAEHGGAVWRVGWSPDGKHLVQACSKVP